MLKKQDRQGVRKASDVEQKYNLTQIQGGNASVVAARRAAQQAEAAAQSLGTMLSQEYIISYLTNNGEAKALYMRDGQIYIDGKYVEGGGINGFSPTIEASPIAGGYRLTITDVDGTQTIDIMNGGAEDLANLQQQVIANTAGIESNEGRITSIALSLGDSISKIEGTDGDYDDLATLTEKVALHTNYISQNAENIAQNDSRIKQLNATVVTTDALQEELGEYAQKSTLANLEMIIDDLQAQIQYLEQRISDMEDA